MPSAPIREVIMQGDATVIQHLNAVLRNEMTAVNQYFLHARMLDHWGAVRLGAHEYDESIDEMKHADLLIKRLLFLGGEPRLEFDRLLIGKSVPEVLECDLRLEQLAMPQLREAIPYCEGVRDFVTRDLFSEILKGEEEHVDFLETQLELIGNIGRETTSSCKPKLPPNIKIGAGDDTSRRAAPVYGASVTYGARPQHPVERTATRSRRDLRAVRAMRSIPELGRGVRACAGGAAPFDGNAARTARGRDIAEAPPRIGDRHRVQAQQM